MLTRRDVLKALPIGIAAISLPILAKPAKAATALRADNEIPNLTVYGSGYSSSGYSTRFIVQSPNRRYVSAPAVIIECQNGDDVKRMGVVCEGDGQIPQAKALLQKWADDGFPPCNTHTWSPV